MRIEHRDGIPWRLGGCARCGGDEYMEYDPASEHTYWYCILCGHRQVFLPPVNNEKPIVP